MVCHYCSSRSTIDPNRVQVGAPRGAPVVVDDPLVRKVLRVNRARRAPEGRNRGIDHV
jgi:hypothetical protein